LTGQFYEAEAIYAIPNTCSTVGTMNAALKGIVQLKYENGVIINNNNNYLPFKSLALK